MKLGNNIEKHEIIEMNEDQKKQQVQLRLDEAQNDQIKLHCQKKHGKFTNKNEVGRAHLIIYQ